MQADTAPLLRATVELDGKLVRLGIPDAFLKLLGQAPSSSQQGPDLESHAGDVRAPVPGTLVQWNVADGDLVQKGDALAVMDAMKMETAVTAPETGVISILAEAGSSHNAGEVIARISPSTRDNSPNLAGQDVPETLE